jgi:hypothetical protein
LRKNEMTTRSGRKYAVVPVVIPAVVPAVVGFDPDLADLQDTIVDMTEHLRRVLEALHRVNNSAVAKGNDKGNELVQTLVTPTHDAPFTELDDAHAFLQELMLFNDFMGVVVMDKVKAIALDARVEQATITQLAKVHI